MLRAFLAISLLAMLAITCKTTRRSSVKVDQTPVDFDDSECYSKFDLASGVSVADAQAAIAGICPNEKLALRKYFDFQNSPLMVMYRDYKKDIDGLLAQAQMEQFSLNGRETPAVGSTTMQTLLTRVRKRNASYSAVLNYFASDVKSENNAKMVSQLDLYKSNKCKFAEDPGLDTAFAYEYCQLGLLADKIRDMATIRATVDPSLLTISSKDTPVIYRSIANELSNLAKEISNTIQTHRAIVDSGDLTKLGASAVPYPAIALDPKFLFERMDLAFAEMRNAASRYKTTIQETYSLTVAQGEIKDRMANLISGNNDSKVQFANIELEKQRLNDEKKKKINEKSMIANEIIKSGERLSKAASDYIGATEPSTYIQPLKIQTGKNAEGQAIFGPDKGLLTANNFAELPSQIIPLKENNLLSGDGTQDSIITMIFNGEQVPSIVANGVYFGVQSRLKLNTDWLGRQPHHKYSSDGFGRSSKKCKVFLSGDPLDHSYTCDPSGITQRVRDATVYLRDKMLNGDMNVYRQYTSGLDGYIQSRSWGQSTSKNTSTNPNNTFANNASLIAGAIGSYYGVPAAGTVVGEMIGYRKPESGSTGTSVGISFTSGYYHALAKYPDIRLGQMVAELGCNGTFNEYIAPKTLWIEGSNSELDKAAHRILTGKVLEDINYPFDSGVLTEAGSIVPPIAGMQPVDFRFPAGNSSVAVIKVPKECSNPTVRLIINDSPLGQGTKNCLTGDGANASEPAAEWTKPLANNEPTNAQCSYFSSSLRLRVSAALLKSDDVKNGLARLNNLGITDSTRKVEQLETIAYNPDSWQAAEAYVKQQLNKEPNPVTEGGIEKLMPLVRAFVSQRVNERNISDLDLQITDLGLRIAQQSNLASQSKDKSDLFAKVIQNAADQELMQGVYKSTLEDQKAVHFNQVLNSLERLATWTSVYFASLEYNQYQKVSVSAKRKEVLALVDDLRRHAIGILNKDDVLIEEVNAVSSGGKLQTTWPAYIDDRIEKIQKLMIAQDDIVATRNKLINNKIGHCFVSMKAIYPNNFVVLDNENFNSDIALPAANAAAILADFEERKKPFAIAKGYRVLLDMSQLPDRLRNPSPETAGQIGCTHKLSDLTSTFPPKILGIGVEMRGAAATVGRLIGKQMVGLKRSNVMSWPVRDATYTDSNAVYRQVTRFVDYSIMQNIAPFSDVNLPLSQEVPIQISKNLPECSPGYTRAVSGTGCIVQTVGANLTAGFGIGPNFAFNPTELNIFLGSQFEIFFTDEAAAGFRDANNIIMHFFYYIPYPLVQ